VVRVGTAPRPPLALAVDHPHLARADAGVLPARLARAPTLAEPAAAAGGHRARRARGGPVGARLPRRLELLQAGSADAARLVVPHVLRGGLVGRARRVPDPVG